MYFLTLVDQTLTFRAARQQRGTSAAQVHAHDVRRVHGVAQVQAGGRGVVNRGCNITTWHSCHLLETSHHCITAHKRTGRAASLLVDPVGEAPAVVGVGVSVSCVDEAVLERSADVVSRQTRDRRHHVSGELSHLQCALVLTSPPVVLGPNETESNRKGAG